MSKATLLSLAVSGMALLASAPSRADMCFTVLDRSNRTIFQSRTAPVDMARPIGDTLYQRFPEASIMVFGQNDTVCDEIRGMAGVRGFGTRAVGVDGAATGNAAGPDMNNFFNGHRYAPRS